MYHIAAFLASLPSKMFCWYRCAWCLVLVSLDLWMALSCEKYWLAWTRARAVSSKIQSHLLDDSETVINHDDGGWNCLTVKQWLFPPAQRGQKAWTANMPHQYHPNPPSTPISTNHVSRQHTIIVEIHVIICLDRHTFTHESTHECTYKDTLYAQLSGLGPGKSPGAFQRCGCVPLDENCGDVIAVVTNMGPALPAGTRDEFHLVLAEFRSWIPQDPRKTIKNWRW